MEQSNEKLTEFTSNLKYKIEATAPDTNHLRIVRHHDNGESHIDLMIGRVVMLANQKYTIIKHISERTEQTIYGYSPNTHVQPTWDYDLTYTTGDADYTIVATVEDAYFIFHNNIGLVTIGSVVRLQNGKDAIITGIEYNFSNNIIIHGKTVDGSYILKWNRDGKNKSFITPDADIASVVTRNFRGGFPIFENFQTTTVSATNKEQAMNMGTEDAPEFGLKALPINELDIKLGSQVKLTNGRVAFTGRIPGAKNPYHYYFVELPGGRERKVDIRPDHRADNLVGVAQVLCGPERLTEYYFDFSKIEEGNTYSYISNGMAQTKTYHNDDTDVLNASNPLVFDTRFLAVWRLNEFKRVLSATGDISVETKQEDERKYEILPEPISAPNGEVCHRIKALKDIPVIGVKKGDLGGCVSNATSLSHSGISWIFEGGFVVGNAIVEGDAIVGDGALVGGTACIGGTAAICKGVVVDSNAQVGGDVVVRHGNIGNGAIVTKQYHYLYVDNVNGRGDECTIYLTEGAIGASVGGLSNARWRALCLDPRVSCITSHELMQTYVKLFAGNSRG
nr:MAG TPA: Putative transferase, nesg, ydcK, Structural Genomics.38A [Caudoviricetes sp.]